MIKSVTITNYLQESVKIELTEPESSGFIIRSIEGLGPVKANLNFTELATLDGALDNGAALLETRNIVLSLIFLGTPTIEDTRLKSYKYFPIKQNLTFEIETDNRHCFTIGRVESNVPTIFGDEREGCQISILCPNSYFQDMEDTTVNFYAADSGFEFPFENNSLTQLSDKNLVYTGDMLRWHQNGCWLNAQKGNSVHVSGISTNVVNPYIAKTESPLTANTKYILTGCPISGGNSTYQLKIYSANGSYINSDTGSGIIFTAPYSIDYDIQLYINSGVTIDASFEPVLRRIASIDGQDVPIGENLLEVSDITICINDVTMSVTNNGQILIYGDHRSGDDDIYINVANLRNIPNNEEYILNGCPANSDLENLRYWLSIIGMDDVERVVDSGSSATFTKTSDEDYQNLMLKLVHPSSSYYHYDNVLFSPMIRKSDIVDPTFEPYSYVEDAGKLIEFGDINANPAGNVFYAGDSETGVTIEIHATGNANGVGIYRLDTNEMMTINDTRLISIVGSSIRAGDTIIINTAKGNKKIQFLRNGVYYNILNALNAPITWFNLRKGDNGFLLNATYGMSNLQYKIIYRTLYEGV